MWFVNKKVKPVTDGSYCTALLKSDVNGIISGFGHVFGTSHTITHRHPKTEKLNKSFAELSRKRPPGGHTCHAAGGM